MPVPAVGPSRDARERELKFDAGEADLAAISARLADTPGATRRPRAAKLTSVYFDTEDRAIGAVGASLRVRRDGRWRTQTLKVGEGGAGLFDRFERERRVYADAPSLDEEESAALEAALGHPLAAEAFSALVSTTVRRVIFDVARGGSTIEVALDEALAEANGERLPFREVELELRSGDLDDLFALARELASVAPLRLGTLTKSARAFRLLDGGSVGAVQAGPSPVRPGMDVEAAFVAIVGDCLAQYRGNEDLLLAGADDKAVHQGRVALRRLRSALKIFRPAVADGRLALVAGEIKLLAHALGAARDLDVFTESAFDTVRGVVDVAPLVSDVAAAREAAYRSALEALRSDRARGALFELAEWTAIGAWRTAPEMAEARHRPIEAFAEDLLAERFAKFLKKSKNLVELTAEKRHRARIEAKALRYASGFLAPLYEEDRKTRDRVDRFDKALKRLLDSLGVLNDIATSRSLALTFGQDAVGRGEAAAAFAAGVVAGAAKGRAQGPLGKADQRLSALKKAKPFWE